MAITEELSVTSFIKKSRSGSQVLNELSYIGQKLNEKGIIWGVGASVLLALYELVDECNDIDILVDMNDIEMADRILSSIGIKNKSIEVKNYSTQYFYEYKIRGFDVDVMAGLAINHSEGTYEQAFDYSCISDSKLINGVEIPLSSLEDWYVIYQLIPNRELKVNIIEDYLLTNGIKRSDLLKKALLFNLPIRVRQNIDMILNGAR